MNEIEIKKANQSKFEAVRSLKLPVGRYAITSSGPLGVRGLRLIEDVDLIVEEKLWEELQQKYDKIIDKNGVTKIMILEGLVEILGKNSFFSNYHPADPTVEEQIKDAEIINGLPFVKLKYILLFKKRMNGYKAQQDVDLITNHLAVVNKTSL